MIQLRPEEISLILSYTIGIFQIIILLIPFIAKGKLYDQRPETFLNGETSIFKRAKRGLYAIILLSVVTLIISIKKQSIDGDIVNAIAKKGYTYNEETKTLIAKSSTDVIDAFKKSMPKAVHDTVRIKNKTTENPLITILDPKTSDSLQSRKTIIYIPIVNNGKDVAKLTKGYCYMFNTMDITKIEPPFKCSINLTDQSILPENSVILRSRPFGYLNGFQFRQDDSIFCLVKVLYSDASGKKKFSASRFFYNKKEDGMTWYGLVTNYQILAVKEIVKKYNLFEER